MGDKKFNSTRRIYTDRREINEKKSKGKNKIIVVAIIVILLYSTRGIWGNNVMEVNMDEPPVTETIRDLDELNKSTKAKCEEFLARCESEGLSVIVTETYRTQARQDYLYAQGRTRDGIVVTQTKSSVHTERKAFDIAKNITGEEYDDDQFFKRCAEIGREVGLNAGYFWEGFQDKAHFQNDDWW